MKNITLFLLILLIPTTIFAETKAVFLQATNHTSIQGNVSVDEYDFSIIKGPVINKNGGTAKWIVNLHLSPHSWATLVSLYDSKTRRFNHCLSNGRNIALDVSKYKDDIINISYDSYAGEDLSCTCSGSACSFL